MHKLALIIRKIFGYTTRHRHKSPSFNAVPFLCFFFQEKSNTLLSFVQTFFFWFNNFYLAIRSRIVIKIDFRLLSVALQTLYFEFFFFRFFFYFTSLPREMMNKKKWLFLTENCACAKLFWLRVSLSCYSFCTMDLTPKRKRGWNKKRSGWGKKTQINTFVSNTYSLYEPNRSQANSRMLHTNESENVNVKHTPLPPSCVALPMWKRKKMPKNNEKIPRQMEEKEKRLVNNNITELLTQIHLPCNTQSTVRLSVCYGAHRHTLRRKRCERERSREGKADKERREKTEVENQTGRNSCKTEPRVKTSRKW